MEVKYETIKSVNEKSGERDGKAWKLYMFECDSGMKYSTFDKATGETFKPGMAVKVTGHQEGQFFKMDKMEEDDGNRSPATNAPNKLPSANQEREASIVAQALTKAYCSGALTDISPADVWEAYQFFLNKQNGN